MAKAKGKRAARSRPAAKHAGGRPPVNGARMGTSINVRVPVEVRAAAEVKAVAAGLTVAEVARELLAGYVAGEFLLPGRVAESGEIPFT